MNTAIYERPEGMRYSIGRLVGNGLLVVEGDKHKQQVCNTPLTILYTI